VAKYWLQNLETDSFSGMKLLVETVAMSAAIRIEKERPKNRMYCAVRQFLRLMKDFRNISVIITAPYTYELDRIPEEIRNQRPLVLDPANPYNNLAHNGDIVMEDFVDSATLTLSKLDRIGRDDWSSIFSYSRRRSEYESTSDDGEDYNNNYTTVDSDSDEHVGVVHCWSARIHRTCVAVTDSDSDYDNY
jgi:hypothetical protein